MPFEVIHLSETDSTNRYAAAHATTGADVVVWADFQTAGRGCGTNTWESEAGQNLLFSVVTHPTEVPAAHQFVLSMANALALKDALDAYTPDVLLKWPNDIYWHDRKLAGTLIETTLGGSFVKSCTFGTGLNVNQTQFRSDAPNPVSLRQILGHAVDRDALLRSILEHVSHYMELVQSGQWALIRRRYGATLYRRGQTHWFRLPDGQRRQYLLDSVDADGHLVLLPADGGQAPAERFGFKEISFII